MVEGLDICGGGLSGSGAGVRRVGLDNQDSSQRLGNALNRCENFRNTHHRRDFSLPGREFHGFRRVAPLVIRLVYDPTLASVAGIAKTVYPLLSSGTVRWIFVRLCNW